MPEIYIELFLNRLKQWGVQISSLVKERRGLVASGRAEDPLEGARGVEGRLTGARRRRAPAERGPGRAPVQRRQRPRQRALRFSLSLFALPSSSFWGGRQIDLTTHLQN